MKCEFEPADRPSTDARRAERGSVAVITAISLTEVVFVLLKQRELQATANAASLAGAAAIQSGNTSEITVEADAIAANAGFTNGTSGTTVTVNNPPLSGQKSGVSTAVEVIIKQPQVLPISNLFNVPSWGISGRAVAIAGSNASNCVLQLDPSGTAAVVSITNGATITLNSCGLAANGAGASAVQATGGGTLNATTVTIVGGYSLSNGGAINASGGIKTNQAAVSNPYAGTATPTATGCAHGSPGNPLSIGKTASTTVLSADGAYCGGLLLSNGAKVSMNPGVYIFVGGYIGIANSTLSGTGVTLVMTGSGTNYTYFNIDNSSSITLSAPTTGSTAGIVLFQDPNAPTSGSDTFAGGAVVALTGAVYFPNQEVFFNNGASSTSSCTQLIAWRINFNGGTTLNNSCSGTGTIAIGATPSKLVE
jgi:hypothetical protein